MVADRHVLPVGKQGVVGVAKHLADVAGVVLARIKVRVVADLDRHVHGDGRDGHEAGDVDVGLVPKVRAVNRHEGLDALAQGDGGRFAELHEGVQHRGRKDFRGQTDVVQEPQGVEDAEVENPIAKAHAWAGRAVRRREDAKREVGEGEIVPLRHLNPRGQVRVCHGAKVVHDGGFVGACHGRAT